MDMSKGDVVRVNYLVIIFSIYNPESPIILKTTAYQTV